jgi:hypothetical protein
MASDVIIDTTGKAPVPRIPPAQRSQDAIGGPSPVTVRDDPGFLPPYDPLRDRKPEDFAIVYRDIPDISVQHNWDPPSIVFALRASFQGQFDLPGQLCDSILGDDRVQATLGSRIGGLFGREVHFRPANDSAAAKEVLDAYAEMWPRFYNDEHFVEIAAYRIMMRVAPAQIVWDTSRPVWEPRLRPFAPRFTYYNFYARKFVALTQDGAFAIEPGDGKWFFFGAYRSWLRGAQRAVAEPWLARHYARRDWAWYSEVHGMPKNLLFVPAASSQIDRDRFVAQVKNMGSRATLMMARGAGDKGQDYGYELSEAKDNSWEGFGGLMGECDTAIVLAINFQNLTTEVEGGGSYAAVKQHGDEMERSAYQSDDKAWSTALHFQIARPFAEINFGDPDLAPWVDWGVELEQQAARMSKSFQEWGTALEVLARAGIKFDDQAELRKFAAERFNLRGLPSFSIGDPPVGKGGGGGSFGQAA